MFLRPGRRAGRRVVQPLAIAMVATSLALAAVGTVTAHSGSPDTIHVTQTASLTVKATGTWSWSADAAPHELSYVGFAIDWGDISTGNAVGQFHIGDGTAATNVVLQPTSPAQGSSGAFGPVSHVYAKAGTYVVCVIIYDLGETKPFATTGWDSLRAGGTDRNTDNSVDGKHRVPAMCGQIAVTDPTPSPVSSVLGATSPPTGTAAPEAPQDGGLPLMPLGLLLGSCLASVYVFKTQKVGRR